METKKININLAECADMLCPRCKSKFFVKTYILKHLPALRAGNPQAMMMAQEMFACSNCFWVMTQKEVDAFRPGKISLQDKTEDNVMTLQKHPTDLNGNPL